MSRHGKVLMVACGSFWDQLILVHSSFPPLPSPLCFFALRLPPFAFDYHFPCLDPPPSRVFFLLSRAGKNLRHFNESCCPRPLSRTSISDASVYIPLDAGHGAGKLNFSPQATRAGSTLYEGGAMQSSVHLLYHKLVPVDLIPSHYRACFMATASRTFVRAGWSFFRPRVLGSCFLRLPLPYLCKVPTSACAARVRAGRGTVIRLLDHTWVSPMVWASRCQKSLVMAAL